MLAEADRKELLMRDMSDDALIMLSEKAAFIKSLETALREDKNSRLDMIAYQLTLETQDEVITVVFKGGSIKRILATGNSNGANAKEIIKAIYG